MLKLRDPERGGYKQTMETAQKIQRAVKTLSIICNLDLEHLASSRKKCGTDEMRSCKAIQRERYLQGVPEKTLTCQKAYNSGFESSLWAKG